MPIRLTNSNAKCLVFKVFLLIITIIVIVDVFFSLVSRNDLVEIKKKEKMPSSCLIHIFIFLLYKRKKEREKKEKQNSQLTLKEKNSKQTRRKKNNLE